MRKLFAAIARVFQRLSEPPEILQVHISNGDLFQVAQKLFDRRASAGEKLAWASEMVDLAKMPHAKMVALYRRGETGFVRVFDMGRDFEPIFLVDQDER